MREAQFLEYGFENLWEAKEKGLVGDYVKFEVYVDSNED